jgi:hypothetical protein
MRRMLSGSARGAGRALQRRVVAVVVKVPLGKVCGDDHQGASSHADRVRVSGASCRRLHERVSRGVPPQRELRAAATEMSDTVTVLASVTCAGDVAASATPAAAAGAASLPCLPMIEALRAPVEAGPGTRRWCKCRSCTLPPQAPRPRDAALPPRPRHRIRRPASAVAAAASSASAVDVVAGRWMGRYVDDPVQPPEVSGRRQALCSLAAVER